MLPWLFLALLTIFLTGLRPELEVEVEDARAMEDLEGVAAGEAERLPPPFEKAEFEIEFSKRKKYFSFCIRCLLGIRKKVVAIPYQDHWAS